MGLILLKIINFCMNFVEYSNFNSNLWEAYILVFPHSHFYLQSMQYRSKQNKKIQLNIKSEKN